MKKKKLLYIFILFIFLLSCLKNNSFSINDFKFSEKMLFDLNKIKHKSDFLDIKKNITIIKTNLFTISNQYIIPFFYFDYIYNNENFNIDNLSNNDITNYFYDMAYDRALNELLFIEAKNNGFFAIEQEITDKITEIAKGDIEQFKNSLIDSPFTYEFVRNDINKVITIEKYKNESIIKNIVISEDEIIKFYNNNPSISYSKPKASIRHILLKTINISKKEKEKKYKKMVEILKRIKAGEDFIKLVKIYSEDESSKLSDGLLPVNIEKGEFIKVIDDFVFSSRKGDISEIIESDYGYHIIKIENLISEAKEPLEQVRNKIIEILTVDKQNDLIEKEKEKVIKKYNLRKIK